jgi:hypothetical protein
VFVNRDPSGSGFTVLILLVGLGLVNIRSMAGSYTYNNTHDSKAGIPLAMSNCSDLIHTVVDFVRMMNSDSNIL